MAPIGLKAVVGESKTLLSLLCFTCDSLRRRPLCVAKSAFTVRFHVFFFSCNMRMFAIVHVGDGDDEEGDDEGRCSVVYATVKPSRTCYRRVHGCDHCILSYVVVTRASDGRADQTHQPLDWWGEAGARATPWPPLEPPAATSGYSQEMRRRFNCSRKLRLFFFPDLLIRWCTHSRGGSHPVWSLSPDANVDENKSTGFPDLCRALEMSRERLRKATFNVPSPPPLA